jgi:hypothetical protein
MSGAEQLKTDLAEFTEQTGITGTVMEAGQEPVQLLCILHGVLVPDTKFSKGLTDILFLTDTNYPGSAMDMFWTDADLTLTGGGIPTNAAEMATYPATGKSWRRFSVHRGPESPWNPNTNGVQQQYLVVLRRWEMPE